MAEVWRAGVPDHRCTRDAWNSVRSSWGRHPLCKQHERMIRERGVWLIHDGGDEYVKPNQLIEEAS